MEPTCIIVDCQKSYLKNQPEKTVDISRRHHWFRRVWRLHEERLHEIPYWFHNDVTTLIWVVPLVGWNNISLGKGQSERYPDLDSDASSVWNFCASSLGPVQTSNLTCAEPNTYLGQPQ